MMRYALLVSCALGELACGSHHAEQPGTPHASSQVAPAANLVVSDAFAPRAYVNDSGITLSMVFLKSEGDQPRQALARFTGLQHPLEGKVVRVTEHQPSKLERVWKVRYDGWDLPLMTEKIASASEGARVITMIWLPRVPVSTYLDYDTKASSAVVASDFLRAHRNQLEDGSLQALEELNRPEHMAKAQKSLDRVNANIDKACGAHVPIEINWESVSDDELATHVPCHDPVSAFAEICKRDTVSRETFFRRIKKTLCSVEGEYGLRLEGDVLHISVAPNQKPHALVAYEQLKKMLELTQTVLRNKAGQFLVFDPDARTSPGRFLYYLGTQNTVHKLRPGSRSSEVWHPRGYTTLQKSSDGLTAVCARSGEKIEFQSVSNEERHKLLSAVKFEEPLWKRSAFALARDDRGIYYYVDRYNAEMGGKDFRVFKGPRGQVRETKLVDIVDDSESMIFATQKGKLRFVVSKVEDLEKVADSDAFWIEGKKRVPLALLPIEDNFELIYYGLGAYDGDKFGLICD